MAIMNNDFQYMTPNTVQEAVQLLKEHGIKAKIIAGGTDLIPKMKANVIRPAFPEYLISLKNLDVLDYITYDECQGLRFGARTTLRTLENHPIVREKYPVLYQGIR